jgi:hypothetical protein
MRQLLRSADGSLRRLGTDRIDLSPAAEESSMTFRFQGRRSALRRARALRAVAP